MIAIAAGNGASYALCDDGSLYAWGANDVGQLGVGDRVKFSSIPVRVPIKEKVESIASGQMHALALTVDGTLYC